jgi:hypothetical protein
MPDFASEKGANPLRESARKTTPNLHILALTMAFFASGLILFIAAMAAAVGFVPSFIRLHSMRGTEGAILAHLLLLGWATMISMGASYQLTQVILRTSIFSRSLGTVHWAAFTIGVLLMAAGFYAGHPWFAVGGSAVLAGVLLYILNLLTTFIRRREWNIYILGVGLSLLSLLMTVLMGLQMGTGANIFGIQPEYDDAFASHLWFGLGGWLAGLIIIYSFKMLPMFLVSAKRPDALSYGIVTAFHLGVWLNAAAEWADRRWVEDAGFALIVLAGGGFVYTILQIRKQGRSRLPMGTVRIPFALVPASYALFLLWGIWKRLYPDGAAMSDEAWIAFLVIGWFSASILGYLARIFPFLWWAHRFKNKDKKPFSIPLSEMLPERRMAGELFVFLGGVSLVCGGMLTGIPALAAAAQGIALLAAFVYIVELLRVFRH